MSLNKRLEIRLSSSEKQAIERKANAAKSDVSKYIRKRI